MKPVLALFSSVLVFAQLPYSSAVAPAENAQELSINRGSAALWQSLKKLHTRASLLMVTAHPDDEDGGMLTYESRGVGSRVALLTLNRGEGGANVMSQNYFDALGLVRTQELLAADRYYGVDQYWTSVIDYGFSKTKAESIARWTHDRVLYDVVRVVRMVRPLVITSVFVGGPSDGHGNHQTAGAMAQEVFAAAGDPNVFPDQIAAGLRPWKPMKDYARAPMMRRGGGGQPLSVNVQVPSGTYDPVLGASYVQIAREGLGYQKSQNGGGSIPPAGQQLSGYHRFGSNVKAEEKEDTFFDGIDISLAGIASLAAGGGDTAFLNAGLAEINAAVEEAIAKFSAQKPDAAAPALARGLNATVKLLEAVSAQGNGLSDQARYDIRHELSIKRAQFNDALAESLGLSIAANVSTSGEADSPNPFRPDPETFRMAIPGQSFFVKVQVANQSPSPVALRNLTVAPSSTEEKWTIAPTAPLQQASPLADSKAVTQRFKVTVPDDAGFTRPYFERPDIEQSYYDLPRAAFRNRPLAPYPLAAWAEFDYQGTSIRVGQVIQTTKRITGLGTVSEPLAVAPAISVAISPHAGIVPIGSKSFAATVNVHSNAKGAAKGKLRLDLPAGWTSQPASADFSFADDGQDMTVQFQVTPANLAEKSYRIEAVADYGGRSYREGYEVTGYPGLRPYFLYRPARYSLSGVNVKVAPGLRIGYIMGSGDEVPASLENLGIKPSFLSPADIATGDLSKYDVLLLGVRTYAAREELRTHKTRLLDYVKNGGVMIVQYNTPEFDHNYGPYPYVMGPNPEEVTDEASKVEILVPSNPIFRWPNQITEKDFTGWVEERGSKWMRTWDPQYQALIETHDEGQEPQKGGLLYAKYGKGVYVYNALAFYRQLPEGVPGAFRIFANIISLAKNPQR